MANESRSNSELDALSSDEKMQVYDAVNNAACRHPVTTEVIESAVKQLPHDLQSIARNEIQRRRS